MNPASRLYFTWPIQESDPTDTFVVRVNGGTWGPLERWTDNTSPAFVRAALRHGYTQAQIEAGEVVLGRAFLVGPEASTDGVPVDSHTLTNGRNTWDVRVSDNPEHIVASGVINVTR